MQNTIKLLSVAVAFSLLSACSARPESIKPSYYSNQVYLSQDCKALSNDLIESQKELAANSEAQNNAADSDAVWVFLVGIPFNKLSGDHEEAVANNKGKIEAIKSALSINGCEIRG